MNHSALPPAAQTRPSPLPAGARDISPGTGSCRLTASQTCRRGLGHGPGVISLFCLPVVCTQAGGTPGYPLAGAAPSEPPPRGMPSPRRCRWERRGAKGGCCRPPLPPVAPRCPPLPARPCARPGPSGRRGDGRGESGGRLVPESHGESPGEGVGAEGEGGVRQGEGRGGRTGEEAAGEEGPGETKAKPPRGAAGTPAPSGGGRSGGGRARSGAGLGGEAAGAASGHTDTRGGGGRMPGHPSGR